MSKLKSAHISIDTVDNGYMIHYWADKESKKGKSKCDEVRVYYEDIDELIIDLQVELARYISK